MTLSEFDFEIEHRPGVRMAHVDALSRALAQHENVGCSMDTRECTICSIVNTEDEVLRIAVRFHDSQSHTGVDRTVQKMHGYYFVPGMRAYTILAHMGLPLVHHDEATDRQTSGYAPPDPSRRPPLRDDQHRPRVTVHQEYA